MKLFHFLSQKWALEALKTQTLKVSKYDDLNDPFELLAMSLDDRVSRTVMNEAKQKINSELRILCCSKRWISPLLWGHYADKHKGIALEFEIPTSSVQEIRYEKDRASIDLNALMKSANNAAKIEMLKMYTTKYNLWSYEEEARIQFTKHQLIRKGDFDFINLGGEVKITGLVLGPLNNITKNNIQEFVPPGQEFTVTTTRIAFKSFNVVHQKQKALYKLTGLVQQNV
jgi:Protein of unknown function (DUF2971)